MTAKKAIKPKDVEAALSPLHALDRNFWSALRAKDIAAARHWRAQIERYPQTINHRLRDMWIIRDTWEDMLALTAVDLEGMQRHDMSSVVDQVLDELAWLRHKYQEEGGHDSERLRSEIDAFIASLDRRLTRHPVIQTAIAHMRTVRSVDGIPEGLSIPSAPDSR